MRIGLDLDNVTFAFQDHWVDLYEQWFDDATPFMHYDEWNCFIDHTRFNSPGEFYTWFEKANGWATMPFIAGARGAIEDLRAAGHTIRFVSVRPKSAYMPTVAALKGFGHFIDLVENKTQIKCDIWLDDAPVSNSSLLVRGDRVVVFNQPWNQNGGAQDSGDTLERVDAWGEFVALVGAA